MKTNSKRVVNIIPLLVAALLLIFGTGYYAYKNGRVNLAPSQKQTKGSSIPTTEPTANWKTYKNEYYKFEFRYPDFLTYKSSGPNDQMQRKLKGEIISGTVTPSFDTITFVNLEKSDIFYVEIFKGLENSIEEYDFQEDYLYLRGMCDLRWGFKLDSSEIKDTAYEKVFVVSGYVVPNHGYVVSNQTRASCYYLNAKYLIVFSTRDKQTVEKAALNQILSTFKFLE